MKIGLTEARIQVITQLFTMKSSIIMKQTIQYQMNKYKFYSNEMKKKNSNEIKKSLERNFMTSGFRLIGIKYSLFYLMKNH